MTEVTPKQDFQIGQRVRALFVGHKPFVIASIYLTTEGLLQYGPFKRCHGFLASDLTLAPERPPYVPSERLVVVIDREERTRLAYLKKVCRCETDAELAARHAVERAEYDAQGDEA